MINLGLVVLLFYSVTVLAQFTYGEPYTIDPALKVDLVTDALSSPTSMTFVDPQHILVLEKNSGDVRLVVNGNLIEEPILYLDVDSATLTCCRGLLGIVSNNHNTTENKLVYIYFTAASNDNTTPIVNKIFKYLWDGRNLIHPSPMLELPAEPGPNHPGGKLALDNKNKVLFTIIGDLNNEGLLQNIKNKNELTDSSVIIRINSIDGSAISSNPFVNIKNDYPQSQVDKYYGYGIRNSLWISN